MIIKDLIRSTPNWSTKTAQQILTDLTTPSVPWEDPTFWTWAGVEAVGGQQCAAELLSFLKANGREYMIYQLGGTGLPIANAEVQQMLLYLHSQGKPGMLTLAQAGKRLKSPAESAALSVSLLDVQDALAELQADEQAAQLQAVKSAMGSAIESAKSLLTGGQAPTLQQVVELITANWPQGV